ncbi:O-methyltransferase [Halobacillus litoralis]|uniref:O-methyltransferase n=1 Tax=Halobacillus litoralis TaxID=45668 RepID=UPI001CD393FA|nr:O-methyltransferase [Halobacillus litoralis]MCA1022297.1 O-methyltransferase [Halobacillus litoralis]
MSERETWEKVDEYVIDRLVTEDGDMASINALNEREGLPSIGVSSTQGKMLYLYVKMKAARRVLEIGTLGGYSSIWMAKALPENGTLTTLEFSPKHAETAAVNMENAGVKDKISIHVGPALETLPALQNEDPFDFVFIDADKENNPHYIEHVLRLSKPGTTILVDNVIRNGEILEEASKSSSIQGIRQMFDLLHHHPRLESTAFQTVGNKGYDGFLLAVVQ